MCVACEFAIEAATKPGFFTQILGYISATFLICYGWLYFVFPSSAKKFISWLVHQAQKIDMRLK